METEASPPNVNDSPSEALIELLVTWMTEPTLKAPASIWVSAVRPASP